LGTKPKVFYLHLQEHLTAEAPEVEITVTEASIAAAEATATGNNC
jgi:hypothetical protein